MAMTVTNLRIALQEGSDNTAYATWEFKNTTPPTPGGGGGGGGSTGGGTVKVGAIVKVKSGSTWYNGVGIAPFVFNDEWVVYEVKGDRVLLNWNKSHTNQILSPIHINNIQVVG